MDIVQNKNFLNEAIYALMSEYNIEIGEPFKIYMTNTSGNKYYKGTYKILSDNNGLLTILKEDEEDEESNFLKDEVLIKLLNGEYIPETADKEITMVTNMVVTYDEMTGNCTQRVGTTPFHKKTDAIKFIHEQAYPVDIETLMKNIDTKKEQEETYEKIEREFQQRMKQEIYEYSFGHYNVNTGKHVSVVMKMYKSKIL